MNEKFAPPPLGRPINAEHRAAQFLNVAMVSVLGSVAVGFMLWMVATEFGAVLGIYRSLSF
jgi:hypothetical protein